MAKGVGNSWSIYTEPGRPPKRASLGDFEDCEEKEAHRTVFFIPELLGGSDYSGGLLQKANHRAFLEKFGRLRGVHDLYGATAPSLWPSRRISSSPTRNSGMS